MARPAAALCVCSCGRSVGYRGRCRTPSSPMGDSRGPRMGVSRAPGTPAVDKSLRTHSPAIRRHAGCGPGATCARDRSRRGFRVVCGILGAVRGRGGGVSRGPFAAALDLIRHRGPDALNVLELGPVLLGHARLSIIDLSDAAQQPLYDTSRRYVIIYNGEIYNFVELRTELERFGHRFASHSDTEVVVEAYKAWGELCLERFNGMFAFFLYDTERRRGFAARDRFGVKPLYWAKVGGDFLFGSEVKPLLEL